MSGVSGIPFLNLLFVVDTAVTLLYQFDKALSV